MIATRLSSVWQVAGVAAAALCCYLVSQSVAAERAGLGKVDRQIAQARDEIARLQTELGTRGRMDQLESWNNQALALKAPRPAQFVADGTQLVALYARNDRPALPLDQNIVASQGATTTVSYQPAPQPKAAAPASAPVVADADADDSDAAPAQPLLRTATYVRPKPQRLAPEAPQVTRAAYHPDDLSGEDAAPVHVAKPARAAARPRLTLASLLPDDIDDIAAAERGKGRRAKADR